MLSRFGSYKDVEQRIEHCLASLGASKKPNFAQLSRDYNVPVDRLRRRARGVNSKISRPGAGHRLNDAQEETVRQYIARCDRLGMPALVPQLKSTIQSILDDDDPSGKAPPLGEHYISRWLARNPDCRRVRQKPQELMRLMSSRIDVYTEHFMELKELLTKYGIQPSDCYNMDETGFRIGVGGAQWIVTFDFERQQSSASDTNRDYVTAIEAINAAGEVLPPMLIAKGTVHLEKWYTQTSIPSNYCIGLSSSGYANDTLMLEWLKHFHLHSSRRQTGAYRLLISDGFGAHSTLEFLKYCDDQKIIPFTLPPHTSQDLQPLDVVCFQPLKHYHKRTVEAATRTGCTDFNKVEFFGAIHSIRAEAFKRSTIKKAWEKVGIWPWNPQIVYQKLQREPAREPAVREPESTPRLARDLSNYSEFIDGVGDLLAEEDRQDCPNIELLAILEWAEVHARSARTNERELHQVTAIQRARQQRQKASQRQVKGDKNSGILTVASARAAVDARIEKDAEKVARAAVRQYKANQQRIADERLGAR